jgi:hypothetical protein
MASIFGFRARSASRDRDTDRSRFARVTELLEQISREIASERDGLQNRYKASSADAAFLVEAMENDAVSARSSGRLDELASSIMRCEQRLAALAQQLVLVEQLRASATAIIAKALAENGEASSGSSATSS